MLRRRLGTTRGIVTAAALVAAAAALQEVMPVLPSTGSRDVDVFVGFLAAAAILMALAAVLHDTRAGVWVLAGLAGAGLAAGVGLSYLTYVVLAGPLKALGALAAGKLVGERVRIAWWLAVAAVVAFALDAWSVFSGPSKAIVEEAPALLDYLLIHFRGLGRVEPGSGVGISDLVVVALFAAAAAQTRLRERTTFVGLWASLPVVLVVALAWERPLPVLPFVALTFLALNGDRLWRSFREERRVSG